MRMPDEIRLDAAARTLTLGWCDGAVLRLSHRQLRDGCPCVECRRLRLAGRPPAASADVALLDVRPMGYGVQLAFSDGHERGIYPWSYFERLAAA